MPKALRCPDPEGFNYEQRIFQSRQLESIQEDESIALTKGTCGASGRKHSEGHKKHVTKTDGR